MPLRFNSGELRQALTQPAPVDTTPPDAPAGLAATAGDSQVALDWNDNSEGDLAGYKVYRSTSSGTSYVLATTISGSTSAHTETGLTNGVTYYFVVTAYDTEGNESAYSSEVSAAPVAPASCNSVSYKHAVDGDGSDEYFRFSGSRSDLAGALI